MNVRIDSFHGIQPRLHPSLLGAGMAVRAHNCRLKNGKLVPLREPSRAAGITTHLEAGLGSIADARSLYAWKHTQRDGTVKIDFLAFPGIVDFAEGNIADDEYDRLFVSGETGVSFTDKNGKVWENAPAVYYYSRTSNAISRKTILKLPLAAPKVQYAEGSTLDVNKTIYYVGFFVSWVDSRGYESGLSPVSVLADESQGESGMLKLNDGMGVKFTLGKIPQDADKVYIYATAAGTSEASDGIQFMAERTRAVASAANGFSVVYAPANLGETEPGIESPPADLSGMQFVSGGYYAGFSKSAPHTVMFSDIGIVTSWPIAYRYDVKDNIVALASTSNSVFALTDGWPWVLSGTAPETMTAAKLAGPAACVSPRGVCVYRNAVYYASNEGLMAIVNSADAGTVCQNITQNIFTKDQWQAFNPSSCLMAQFDGALFLFFKDRNGKPLDGLVIDLTESKSAVTTHNEAASCVCTDNREDVMYFVREREE